MPALPPPPLTSELTKSIRFTISEPQGYYFEQVETFVQQVIEALTFYEQAEFQWRHAAYEMQVESDQQAYDLQRLRSEIELFKVQGSPLVNADGSYVTESQQQQVEALLDQLSQASSALAQAEVEAAARDAEVARLADVASAQDAEIVSLRQWGDQMSAELQALQQHVSVLMAENLSLQAAATEQEQAHAAESDFAVESVSDLDGLGADPVSVLGAEPVAEDIADAANAGVDADDHALADTSDLFEPDQDLIAKALADIEDMEREGKFSDSEALGKKQGTPFVDEYASSEELPSPGATPQDQSEEDSYAGDVPVIVLPADFAQADYDEDEEDDGDDQADDQADDQGSSESPTPPSAYSSEKHQPAAVETVAPHEAQRLTEQQPANAPAGQLTEGALPGADVYSGVELDTPAESDPDTIGSEQSVSQGHGPVAADDPYAEYDAASDEADHDEAVPVIPVDSELAEGIELPGTGEAAITYPPAAPGLPLDTRGVPVEVWAPELDPRIRAAIADEAKVQALDEQTKDPDEAN